MKVMSLEGIFSFPSKLMVYAKNFLNSSLAEAQPLFKLLGEFLCLAFNIENHFMIPKISSSFLKADKQSYANKENHDKSIFYNLAIISFQEFRLFPENKVC